MIELYIVVGKDSKKKVQAVPLQAWRGSEGSRSLRIPDFQTIGTWMLSALKFLPQPPNVRTHRATRNLHIPNQQHTVYRRSWGRTCRSETCRAVKYIVKQVVPQPPNVWTHRATHNPHIPNQQHTVYRRSWGWTCRSETFRAVKHIANKYSTIIKVLHLVGVHM
jgi:hypothetical protein